MLKKSFILLFILLTSQLSFAEKPVVSVPIEVDSVQTHRVDDSLIRIIQYNMELAPCLVIERLETPKLKLAQKLVIKKLTIGKNIIDFENSSGTFIESLELKKGVIYFTVEHAYSGTSGGEIIVKCSMNVNNNKLMQPTCFEK